MRTRLNAPANGIPRESVVLTFSALLVLLGRRSRQSIYDLMRRDPRSLGRGSLVASSPSAGCALRSCNGSIPGRWLNGTGSMPWNGASGDKDQTDDD